MPQVIARPRTRLPQPNLGRLDMSLTWKWEYTASHRDAWNRIWKLIRRAREDVQAWGAANGLTADEFQQFVKLQTYEQATWDRMQYWNKLTCELQREEDDLAAITALNLRREMADV